MSVQRERESQLSVVECEVMVGLLEAHGAQELASAHLFASGVRLAPSLDEKQLLSEQVWDELHHLELVAVLYDAVAGRDLVQQLQARVGALPQPGNWLEMATVAFLSDRVGNAVLAAAGGSSYPPYAAVAQRIFDGEAEHQKVTGAILGEVCAEGPEAKVQAQGYLESWLAASLSELTGDRALLFERAKQLGLLARGTEEIRCDLLARLKPDIEAAGLVPPSLKGSALA